VIAVAGLLLGKTSPNSLYGGQDEWRADHSRDWFSSFGPRGQIAAALNG
jgi:hypothetical protein